MEDRKILDINFYRDFQDINKVYGGINWPVENYNYIYDCYYAKDFGEIKGYVYNSDYFEHFIKTRFKNFSFKYDKVKEAKISNFLDKVLYRIRGERYFQVIVHNPDIFKLDKLIEALIRIKNKHIEDCEDPTGRIIILGKSYNSISYTIKDSILPELEKRYDRKEISLKDILSQVDEYFECLRNSKFKVDKNYIDFLYYRIKGENGNELL